MQVSPSAAPLAQVNPLAAYKGGMMSLFSTHPPTEKRVEALERMAVGRQAVELQAVGGRR
jgi:heat shock protein HtpX